MQNEVEEYEAAALSLMQRAQQLVMSCSPPNAKRAGSTESPERAASAGRDPPPAAAVAARASVSVPRAASRDGSVDPLAPLLAHHHYANSPPPPPACTAPSPAQESYFTAAPLSLTDLDSTTPPPARGARGAAGRGAGDDHNAAHHNYNNNGTGTSSPSASPSPAPVGGYDDVDVDVFPAFPTEVFAMLNGMGPAAAGRADDSHLHPTERRRDASGGREESTAMDVIRGAAATAAPAARALTEELADGEDARGPADGYREPSVATPPPGNTKPAPSTSPPARSSAPVVPPVALGLEEMAAATPRAANAAGGGAGAGTLSSTTPPDNPYAHFRTHFEGSPMSQQGGHGAALRVDDDDRGDGRGHDPRQGADHDLCDGDLLAAAAAVAAAAEASANDSSAVADTSAATANDMLRACNPSYEGASFEHEPESLLAVTPGRTPEKSRSSQQAREGSPLSARTAHARRVATTATPPRTPQQQQQQQLPSSTEKRRRVLVERLREQQAVLDRLEQEHKAYHGEDGGLERGEGGGDGHTAHTTTNDNASARGTTVGVGMPSRDDSPATTTTQGVTTRPGSPALSDSGRSSGGGGGYATRTNQQQRRPRAASPKASPSPRGRRVPQAAGAPASSPSPAAAARRMRSPRGDPAAQRTTDALLDERRAKQQRRTNAERAEYLRKIEAAQAAVVARAAHDATKQRAATPARRAKREAQEQQQQQQQQQQQTRRAPTASPSPHRSGGKHMASPPVPAAGQARRQPSAGSARSGGASPDQGVGTSPPGHHHHPAETRWDVGNAAQLQYCHVSSSSRGGTPLDARGGASPSTAVSSPPPIPSPSLSPAGEKRRYHQQPQQHASAGTASPPPTSQAPAAATPLRSVPVNTGAGAGGGREIGGKAAPAMPRSEQNHSPAGGGSGKRQGALSGGAGGSPRDVAATANAATTPRAQRGSGSYLRLRQTLVSSTSPAGGGGGGGGAERDVHPSSAATQRGKPRALTQHPPARDADAVGSGTLLGGSGGDDGGYVASPCDADQHAAAATAADAHARRLQAQYKKEAFALSRRMIDTADKLHSRKTLMKKLQKELDTVQNATLDASFEVSSQVSALKLQRDELQKQLQQSMFLAGKRRQADAVRQLQRITARREEIEKELARGHDALSAAQHIIASLRDKKRELAGHLRELEAEHTRPGPSQPATRQQQHHHHHLSPQRAQEAEMLRHQIAGAARAYPGDIDAVDVLERLESDQRACDAAVDAIRERRETLLEEVKEAEGRTPNAVDDANEVRCRRAAEAHWMAVLDANEALTHADAAHLCDALREHAAAAAGSIGGGGAGGEGDDTLMQREVECLGAAEVVEAWLATTGFSEHEDVHTALSAFMSAIAAETDGMEAAHDARRRSSEADCGDGGGEQAAALAQQLAAVERDYDTLLRRAHDTRKHATVERRRVLAAANRAAEGAEGRCAELLEWRQQLAEVAPPAQQQPHQQFVEDEGQSCLVDGGDVADVDDTFASPETQALIDETRAAVANAAAMEAATTEKANAERARLHALERELDELAAVEAEAEDETHVREAPPTQQGRGSRSHAGCSSDNPTLRLQWQLLDNLQEELERAEAAQARSVEDKHAQAEQRERALVHKLAAAKADATMLQAQEKDLEREMARLTAEYNKAQQEAEQQHAKDVAALPFHDAQMRVQQEKQGSAHARRDGTAPAGGYRSVPKNAAATEEAVPTSYAAQHHQQQQQRPGTPRRGQPRTASGTHARPQTPQRGGGVRSRSGGARGRGGPAVDVDAAATPRDRVHEAIVESLGKQQQQQRRAATPTGRGKQQQQQQRQRSPSMSSRRPVGGRGAPVQQPHLEHPPRPHGTEARTVAAPPAPSLCPTCDADLVLDAHGRPIHPFCGFCGGCVAADHPLLPQAVSQQRRGGPHGTPDGAYAHDPPSHLQYDDDLADDLCDAPRYDHNARDCDHDGSVGGVAEEVGGFGCDRVHGQGDGPYPPSFDSDEVVLDWDGGMAHPGPRRGGSTSADTKHPRAASASAGAPRTPRRQGGAGGGAPSAAKERDPGIHAHGSAPPAMASTVKEVQLWGPTAPPVPVDEARREMARVREIADTGKWVVKKLKVGYGRRLLRLASDLSRLEIRKPGKKVTEDFLRLDRIHSVVLARASASSDATAPPGQRWCVITQSARMDFISDTDAEAREWVHVLSTLVTYRANLFFLKYNMRHLR